MTKQNPIDEFEPQLEELDIVELEGRLGYSFQDKSILQRALTHPSVSDDHNDTMEFRGDKIMAFIISEVLHAKFPEYSAADRTETLNALTCNLFLREQVARPMGIASFMLIEADESTPPKTVSDCVEALICAVYDDGGVKEAAKFIDRHWLPHLRYKNAADEPVMKLSAYFNSVGLPEPKYSEYKRQGKARELVLNIPAHGALDEPITVKTFHNATRSGNINRARIRDIKNDMATEALLQLGVITTLPPTPESP